AFTNDLDRVGPSRAQYTHLLDPTDAHVVDDIIVWWVAPGDFLVMPNASNTQPLIDALGEAALFHGRGECEVDDVTPTRAVLAVQGPEARARLATIAPEHADVARFAVEPLDFGGAPGWIAGTGYTGEDGVELHVPAAAAAQCWQLLAHARPRHRARVPPARHRRRRRAHRRGPGARRTRDRHEAAVRAPVASGG